MNATEEYLDKLLRGVSGLNEIAEDIETAEPVEPSDVSDADNYKFNIEAYNLYTTMWSTYLLDIEQIINNIKETKNGLSKFKYDIFTENDGIDELPLYQQLIS